jgi:hypothetical protein
MNYMLLGFIIEQITGALLPHNIRTRIREPLDMQHTYFEYYEPTVEGAPQIDTYYNRLNLTRKVNTSYEWAGGGLVSTTAEVGRFIEALFAGELSAHYYFQANKNGESSTLAAFTLLNLMAETKKPISELVADLRRYHHSGEINSEVEDKTVVMEKLKNLYAEGELSELDGIKIRMKDWWFNVRPSNTEPVLRLNLEAKTKELMEEKTTEILSIIRNEELRMKNEK